MHRAQYEGRELRVHRGGPRQQERAPPQLQPGTQEDPRPHPWRQARLRVARHRAVRRRGLGLPHGALHPPRRSLPPRRRPLLDSLRRRQAGPWYGRRFEGGDGGGEGGEGRRGAGGAVAAGEGVRRGLEREALLRRRLRRVRRPRAREQPALPRSYPQDARRAVGRRREDPAPGGVGGAFRGGRGGQGGGAGCGRDGGVRQENPGSSSSCCQVSGKSFRLDHWVLVIFRQNRVIAVPFLSLGG